MSRIPWYGPTHGGKRYYVIGVSGYSINQQTVGRGSNACTTTYAVLDRDWCHREMGVFVPQERGRSTKQCKKAAEAFCDKLNRLEARDG